MREEGNVQLLALKKFLVTRISARHLLGCLYDRQRDLTPAALKMHDRLLSGNLRRRAIISGASTYTDCLQGSCSGCFLGPEISQ